MCNVSQEHNKRSSAPPPHLHSQHTTSTQLTRIKWNGSGETFRNHCGTSSFSEFYPLIRPGQPLCQLMRPNFFLCVYYEKLQYTHRCVHSLILAEDVIQFQYNMGILTRIFSAGSTVPHLPCIAVNPHS